MKGMNFLLAFSETDLVVLVSKKKSVRFFGSQLRSLHQSISMSPLLMDYLKVIKLILGE